MYNINFLINFSGQFFFIYNYCIRQKRTKLAAARIEFVKFGINLKFSSLIFLAINFQISIRISTSLDNKSKSYICSETLINLTLKNNVITEPSNTP